ncbi:MAG TPA: GTP cyclohydrolase I, partial [Gemmatimonadaceae bacterium]|nr:GTP cyclohydrolase I [Gemmatimonadaceae bacterium]
MDARGDGARRGTTRAARATPRMGDNATANAAQPAALDLERRPRVRAEDVADPETGWELDLDPVDELYPGSDGLGPAGRALAGHVHEMLSLLGEAPSRPGLRKTPLRVANALAWLTRGYGQSVAAVVGDAVFPERHE